MDKRRLNGRKEICAYTGRSWPTVQNWIDQKDFPARRLDGIWISMTDLIDDWTLNVITAPANEESTA